MGRNQEVKAHGHVEHAAGLFMVNNSNRIILNRLAACSTLFMILLFGCGSKVKEIPLASQLQLEPIQSIYIQYDSRQNIFRLGNEFIERHVYVDTKTRHVITSAFINKLSQRNYIKSAGEEFSFRANGTKLSGVSGDFDYVKHEILSSGDIKNLVITLRANKNAGILEVRLVYEIYSHIPVIRKWIEIENSGGSSVTVDSIMVESLNLSAGPDYDMEIYDDSQNPGASDKNIESFSPIAFNPRLSEGFLIGNEAPGVLKYSSIHSVGAPVSIGMKPYFQSYAAEVQLAPKDTFISPAAFIFLFKGDPDQSKDLLSEFIREYLIMSKAPEYYIWHENITSDMTESQIFEKIQSAKKANTQIFCLGGTWAYKNGDWTDEKNEIVRKISQYAHDLGMKFGVCINFAAADAGSQVFADHPQWSVKLKDGSDYSAPDGKLMCMGSEYAVYIAYIIDDLVKDLNLDYVKLTGTVTPDMEKGGCFAKDHLHQSSGESLRYIYDGFFALIRYLHSQHGDLIVDVAQGSYNPSGKIDYALLKYADINLPF